MDSVPFVSSDRSSSTPRRVFVAGGSGLIGQRLIPLLVADGHEVAATTRSASKAPALAGLGAVPIVCDVFDFDRFADAVVDYAPSVLFHNLTNLPDDQEQMSHYGEQHLRTLREGTANVVAGAERARVSQLIAQSVAWELPGGGGAAYAELERLVLEAHGVVLRYGRWYGPGTWMGEHRPLPPRIHVDDAAARARDALNFDPGVHLITETEERSA
jgi:nucleoside-diphosphate-sugar epimerase